MYTQTTVATRTRSRRTTQTTKWQPQQPTEKQNHVADWCWSIEWINGFESYAAELRIVVDNRRFSSTAYRSACGKSAIFAYQCETCAGRDTYHYIARGE